MASAKALALQKEQEVLEDPSHVHRRRGPRSTQTFEGSETPRQPATAQGPVKASGTDERQINIWKQELKVLKGQDRRTRYEMGKRLAAIQAERAKAKIGAFTTVDLKELKIPIHTAYRLITFYKRGKARIEADLLQFAKDQEKFPLEDVEEYEKRRADAEVDALNQIMNEEDVRIAELKKKEKNYSLDYRVVITLASRAQVERFKQKWLSTDAKVRSKLVYREVMNAKNSN